jgi:hypothetical protein
MTISENYRNLNSQLHATHKSFGTSGKKWATAIQFLHTEFKINSILDYGCGKQTLAAALPKLNIAGYDPAIPELSEKPNSADLVVCGDVLEHIEPEFLDNVIEDLYRLSKKITFIVLSTREAKKTLQDGRNAHLIVQSADWWIKKFEDKFEVLFMFESQTASELVFLMSSKKSKIRKILNKIKWIFTGQNCAGMFLACTKAYE